MLDLKETIVNVAAPKTEKDIAQKIIRRRGDYVLALKANHPNQFDDARFYLDSERERRFETAPHDSTNPPITNTVVRRS